LLVPEGKAVYGLPSELGGDAEVALRGLDAPVARQSLNIRYITAGLQ